MGTSIVRQRVETPERWQKALQRALDGGVEIFRIAGTGEMVTTSATNLDTVYRVDGRQCECEAALAGDPICIHRAAARFILGWLPAVEAPAPIDCPQCHGGGVVYVRECEQAGWPHPECLDCGGSGLAPDHRLRDAPSIQPVVAAA